MSNHPELDAYDESTRQFRMHALMEILEEEDNRVQILTWEQLEMFSQIYIHQLKATRELQSILASKEGYESVKGGIERFTVERLQRFLAEENEEQAALQRGAACALSNLASWTTEILTHDIPFYVRLGYYNDDIISEQAFTMMGKLACRSVQTRDLLLENGAMDSVLAQLGLSNRTKTSKLRRVTETLSVLYRNQPELPTNKVIGAVMNLSRIISLDRDSEVRYWSCWCIYHMSKGTSGELQRLVNTSVCHTLTRLLRSQHIFVVLSAVSAVESIVSRDPTGTKRYHAELIRPLCNLLRNNTDSFVLSKTLDTLSTILSAAEDTEKELYVKKIADEGGWDRIKVLRKHQYRAISHKAKEIVERIYGVPFLTAVAPYLTVVCPFLIVVAVNLLPLPLGNPAKKIQALFKGSVKFIKDAAAA